MGNFSPDFFKRPPERRSNINSFQEVEYSKDDILEEDNFESEVPPMPAKVVALSGKYEDKYMPKDDFSGLRELMKVPVVQMLAMAFLGVMVAILLIIALS